ncbi:hypothetical protein [Streptomyces meridianus]|uniref:Uncharacterized protein n=1 Tax=Streptomyces meridianus TaxID=2938945 RepID=A0ABT0XC92_9ACTN|nr:hypothetical protein [Streptomyces meridianus]MCM2580136.1 hypothetical protein [Streptomyces meridianus]
MTAHDERSDRAEQLRDGSEAPGAQGVAADGAREVRQARLTCTRVGVVVVIAGVVGLLAPLVHGELAGVGTLFLSGGTTLAAVGVLLARRVPPRLALAVILAGLVVMVVGDPVMP